MRDSRALDAWLGERASWNRPIVGVGLMCAIMVLGDWIEIGNWLDQRGTAAYLPAEGRVLESRVDEHSDSESGTSYEAVVRYEYRVRGRRHESDRVMYGPPRGEAAARRLAARFRAGEAITAYYAPDDPGEAVLVRDSDRHAARVVRMMPLNVAMLVGLVTIGGRVRAWWRGESGTPCVIRDGRRARLRLTEFGPWQAAAVGLVAAGLAGTMVFDFGALGRWGNVWAINATSGVVGLAAAWWRACRLRCGDFDLVINAGERTLALAPAHNGGCGIVVALDDVTGVRGRREVGKDSDGDRVVRYHVDVMWDVSVSGEDGGERTGCVEVFDLGRPAALAMRWLAEELRACGVDVGEPEIGEPTGTDPRNDSMALGERAPVARRGGRVVATGGAARPTKSGGAARGDRSDTTSLNSVTRPGGAAGASVDAHH